MGLLVGAAAFRSSLAGSFTRARIIFDPGALRRPLRDHRGLAAQRRRRDWFPCRPGPPVARIAQAPKTDWGAFRRGAHRLLDDPTRPALRRLNDRVRDDPRGNALVCRRPLATQCRGGLERPGIRW